MKSYLKLVTLLIVLTGVLIFSRVVQGYSVSGHARQLNGQAAQEFLSREGILEKIAADLADVPPQGRLFGEPPPVTASDGANNDYFGVSVALDGDTALVGAYWADVSGTANQGAAYIFTRGGTTWIQGAKLVAQDGTAGDSFGVSVALDGDTALVGARGADVGGEVAQGAAYVFTRSGTTWSQGSKLVAADGAADDRFGHSVALDGDLALVGATQADPGGSLGAAYVFTRDGTTWSQAAKLVAQDSAALENFGISVALDGDTALVGADTAQVNGQVEHGAAYVFIRAETTWYQQAKLVALDGTASDHFGISVALDGDTALVGANYVAVNGQSAQGAAYIFTRGGTTWSQAAKLTAQDGAAGDFFGRSVALDGDTALVGADYAEVNGHPVQGAAYVFTREGTTWSQEQKLAARDGAADDRFGYAVALDGDTALAGARGADVGGKSDAGKVYISERGPVPWPLTSSSVANDGADFQRFGVSVALDGDTALVGAYNADVNGKYQGAAYVFTRDGPIWEQQQKLVALDGAAEDRFGRSVALVGDTALVGAIDADVGGNVDQGAAYVFIRGGTTWSQEAKLTAQDGIVGDRFGGSVSLDGNTALIGALEANVGRNIHQGAAYIFTHDGTTWSQEAKLVAQDGAVEDYFGCSVALDGDMALVGADYADVSVNSNQGAAYIFTRDGTNWNQGAKLTAQDGAAEDYFGDAVALEGDTALIGTIQADVNGMTNQGAAYVFTRGGTTWSQGAKLVAADGGAYDYFGASVGLDGDTALVGAQETVSGEDFRGAAYVFTRGGATWHQEAKLAAVDGATFDYFGNSVALDGDTALVGADGADVGTKKAQGRVYFFERQAPISEVYLPLVSR